MRRVGWLLALLVPGLASAQSCYTWYQSNFSGSYITYADNASASSIGGQDVSAYNSAHSTPATGCLGDGHGGCGSYSFQSCTPDAADASHLVSSCTYTRSTDSQVASFSVRGHASSGAVCVNKCTAKAGQAANITFSGACGSIKRDQDGCLIDGGNTISVSIGGQVACGYTGTYTGSQDTSSGTKGSPGSCITSASGTVCTEGTKAKNCGTFNGDEVCVSSVPPGSCVSFASGGVACTATTTNGVQTMTSPPAPNNGTVGTPATATGAVTQTTNGVSTTTNYYNSTVVNGSSGGVGSTPGGQNVGNGGTGSGSSGTGSGSGGSTPNAANGDCGASGVNCSGDGQVPQLPQVATMQSTAQTYYSALAQTPIAQAVSGLAGSLPSGGSCPTTSFSVFGRSYVIDVQCDLWATYVQPIMTVIMLAFWTIVGIRIALSA